MNEALTSNDIDLTEKLLSKNILYSIRDMEEYKKLPPLKIAILKKSIAMVKLLVSHGENVNDDLLKLAIQLSNEEISLYLNNPPIFEEPLNNNGKLNQNMQNDEIKFEFIGEVQDN